MIGPSSFEHDGVVLEYVQKGIAPGWLIHLGTHGDEYGIALSFMAWLRKNWSRMPDFLCVLAVSPSAVIARSRCNRYSHDLNRMFRRPISDPEAAANLALIGNRSFNFGLFVHEDLEHRNKFYAYDSFNERGSAALQECFAKFAVHGIEPFTGIDDQADPVLGCQIVDGYYSEQEDWSRRDRFPDGDGTMMDFARRAGIVKLRRLNPEFPGRASMEIKELITGDFMEYLLKWWYG